MRKPFSPKQQLRSPKTNRNTLRFDARRSHVWRFDRLPRPSILLLVLLLAASSSAHALNAGELPANLRSPQQVEAITAEQFQQVLEAHEGKVIMVNLWATWCIPCIQELPEMDLLQQRYRERGLKVLAVSFDKASILESKVRPFFAKTAPNLVSYLQAEEVQFDFVSTLDPEWLGGLPTTFFIDREGKVVESTIGRMLYKDMEKQVLGLLGE